MTEPRRRITVSLPADVADEIQQAVATGAARDASAFVASAVRRYRRRLSRVETIDAVHAEYGSLPDGAKNWAARVARHA